MLLAVLARPRPATRAVGRRRRRLVDAGARTPSRTPSEIAPALAARGYERVVYLGSGALTGLAQESALKLLELTAGRTVTYFDSALGFRHGPKAVLDEQHARRRVLSADPYTRLYDEDIAAELRAAVGPTTRCSSSARGPASRLGDFDGDVSGLDGMPRTSLASPAVRRLRPDGRACTSPWPSARPRTTRSRPAGQPGRAGRDHPPRRRLNGFSRPAAGPAREPRA